MKAQHDSYLEDSDNVQDSWPKEKALVLILASWRAFFDFSADDPKRGVLWGLSFSGSGYFAVVLQDGGVIIYIFRDGVTNNLS